MLLSDMAYEDDDETLLNEEVYFPLVLHVLSSFFKLYNVRKNFIYAGG